jgi:hypothetical protein
MTPKSADAIALLLLEEGLARHVKLMYDFA